MLKEHTLLTCAFCKAPLWSAYSSTIRWCFSFGDNDPACLLLLSAAHPGMCK